MDKDRKPGTGGRGREGVWPFGVCVKDCVMVDGRGLYVVHDCQSCQVSLRTCVRGLLKCG